MDAVGEGLPRIPCARVPNAVTLEPEEVTAPERFALVVTVSAFPPILREDVATCTSAEPSAFEYKRRFPVKEVRPVPPVAIATVPVTFAEVPPILREEVATCTSALPSLLE